VLSYDVLRSVNTAIALLAIAAMFLKIGFTDSTIGRVKVNGHNTVHDFNFNTV